MLVKEEEELCGIYHPMRATCPAYLPLLDTIISVPPIFCKKHKFGNSSLYNFVQSLLYFCYSKPTS
jgi:hypothetical protein